RALLTVDTEEEFDWSGDFSATDHGLKHVGSIARFQQFCEELGAAPVYLCDWPITQSAEAVELIGDAVTRGKAEIGIQLHPWVNPPFDEEVSAYNSYAGNLPPQLERAKFMHLRDEIERRFDTQPLIYRAGRYGLGQDTAELLKDAGVAIDTSVRSNFDYRPGHGPDYRRHPLEPYWVDAQRELLELPVTSVFWGMLRRQGRLLQPLAAKLPLLPGILARTGMLERIALTPEGVTASEAIRGIDIALDDGLPLLVLSFHSPSLAPGYTPYVRSEADLEALYEWFRQIYAYLARRGVAPTSVKEVMAQVRRD
ncbi:MAG: polysaccharide deacetylase family protein, partial [Hyphomonas sp.]|uniref:polysaccharide deacetylase family protein n=1 Tax=Hyphomonas sp. TaxID=87 RepID=UPI003297CF25